MLTVANIFDALFAKSLVPATISTKGFSKKGCFAGWSNEVYGRKACLFYRSGDAAKLAAVKEALTEAGAKFDRWDVENGLCVQVAYFKGWHHAE